MDIIEWCRLHDIWYLKIDLEIPDVCISEAQAVYDEGFVDHSYGDGDGWGNQLRQAFTVLFQYRQTHDLGWYHTKNPNGHGFSEENIKWGWTEVQDAPETKRWLEDFPHKTYRRCRFMLLKPNGRIGAHNDREPERFPPEKRRTIAAINLAFYQPDNCYLRRADTKEELPFENCTGFLV